MALYKNDAVNIELNTGKIYRSFMGNTIGKGDSKANWFGVRLFRNGEPVSAEDATVTGLFVAPDGMRYVINETSYPGSTWKSGNEASVQLPGICYAVDGQFTLAIKLSGGGVEGTMRIVDGMVSETGEDGAVVPTSTIPATADIIEAYEEAIAVMGGSVRFDASQTLSDTEQVTARGNIGAAGIAQVVRVDDDQELTDAEKTQARENIGASGIAQVVRIDEDQSLTDAQKATARSNIGAADAADITNIQEDISDINGEIDDLENDIDDINDDLSDISDRIVPEFDSSASYVEGQYVTHEGKLYRFAGDHSGSWNSADVWEVNTGMDLLDIIQGAYGAVDNVAAKATWTPGYYIGANGNIGTNPYMRYSSLIPVDGRFKYTFVCVPFASTLVYRIHGYDAEGTWKKNIAVIAGAEVTLNRPARASFFVNGLSYIRISIAKQNDSIYLFADPDSKAANGDADSETELYSVTHGSNIMAGTTWTEHTTLDTYGEVQPSLYKKTSDYVKINKAKGYTISFSFPFEEPQGIIMVAGYDEEKEYTEIVRAIPENEEIVGGTTSIRIAPQGSTFIRVSVPIGYSVSISEGEPISNSLFGCLLTKSRCTFESGSIDHTTGNNFSSDTRARTVGYADLSAVVITSDLFLFAVYVYDRDTSFVGVWDGTELKKGKAYWFSYVDMANIYEMYKATHPNFLYRLIVRRLNNSTSLNTTTIKNNMFFYTRAGLELYATPGVYLNWAVCGASYDSGFTVAHGGNNYPISWPQILARRLGNTCMNYSKSGFKVGTFISDATGRGLTQALADSAKELYVLTLGGNDASGDTTIGSLTDITSHSDWHDYPATFYGMYGQIMDRLMEHAPDAKFIMTTPSSPVYSERQTLVDNACREIAGHYQIPFITWDDDDFMKSDFFIKNMGNNQNHPTVILYSGMALAFERLFSKCAMNNPAYFAV